MSARRISLRLIGDRPLLMHASRLADPLDPAAIALAKVTSKRGKTEADHRMIAKLEFMGGLWLNEGKPCIPAEALEASFISGAKTRKKGPAAQSGLRVLGPAPLIYDGPADLEKLYADPAFSLRCPVRVGNARTIRTRPRFPDWQAVVEVEFLPSMLDEDDVLACFSIAGATKAIGDWRPRYGRYRVERISS